MTQLGINRDQIREFCEKNAISYMALFGSYARGEAREDSDVDVIVRFKKRVGLFGLVGAEMTFSKLLGKEVDMFTEKSISRYIRDNVMKDLVTIYEDKN